MGVRVAIDDFGAGYTRFRNLQMLHVDTVKIDGSYVKDLSQSPENQVFVRTLVGLAKNFDIKTVAEWVGSDDDAALLQSFGVDYFQGFHFGEPVIDPKWVLILIGRRRWRAERLRLAPRHVDLGIAVMPSTNHGEFLARRCRNPPASGS